jgi:hypothetical protein
MKAHRFGKQLIGLVAAICLGGVLASAKTTTATSSGNWNDAIWDNGAPVADDAVAVNSGVSVALSNASPALTSFVNHGTLSFSGWNTALTAVDIEIDGTVTHLTNSATATNELGQWVPDARVYFVCTNLILNAGKTIDANGKGYQGGRGVGTNGFGPGGGQWGTANGSAGGSHGGLGGWALWGSPSNGASHSAPGPVYGLKSAPVDPGSGGGGSTTWTGGAGGGAVRVEASGHVLINGTITVNGTIGTTRYGGGSGGSVYVTCRTFGGTNGLIRVNGADGHEWGGSGGGGRIAINASPSAQAAMPQPAVILSSRAGTAPTDGRMGSSGTGYAIDGSVLPAMWAHDISVSGFTNYSTAQMIVTNCRFVVEDRARITVAGAIRVIENARLDVVDPWLSAGGSLTISNASLYALRGTNLSVRPSLSVSGADLQNANLFVYAGTTNTGIDVKYDVLVTIAGALTCRSNAWIYPVSHGTNGGSVKFEAGSVNVSDTNAGFQANARGYAGGRPFLGENGQGPGKGLGGGIAGGGGYGGSGSKGAWGGAGGSVYGVSNAPVVPGSGGGSDNNVQSGAGGTGGGLIWIESSGSISVKGKMTANGTPGVGYYGPGGGSGGGIYLRCKKLEGADTGQLLANGAASAGWGGPGGGGRIAVWTVSTNSWQGSVSANGALAASFDGGRTNGAPGTVVWEFLKAPGTVLVVK